MQVLLFNLAFGQNWERSQKLSPSIQGVVPILESSNGGGVVAALSTIEDGADRVTQLLTVITDFKTSPEVRSELAAFLFRQPISRDGISMEHLPLLCRFYINAEEISPAFFYPSRTFLGSHAIQSRLLNIIASLLSVEQLRREMPQASSLENLRSLLDSAKASRIYQNNEHLSESLDLVSTAAMSLNHDSKNFDGFSGAEPSSLPQLPPPNQSEASPGIRIQHKVVSEHAIIFVSSVVAGIVLILFCFQKKGKKY